MGVWITMVDGAQSAVEPAVMSRPNVSAVLVSYNTRETTLKCLAALSADLGDLPAELIVVDNDSTDGSPAAIRQAFPAVTVVDMGRNAGFGAANNVGMTRARGEWLLLLNTDAFPKPGAIAALIDCLRRHPEAAMVGPRLLNADGSLQRSCWRFPTPGVAWRESLWINRLFSPTSRLGDLQRWAHDHEREVEWVIGACLLVRRSAYEQVGGFDEKFFLYAEETDWERRMHDAGWTIRFTPAAEVVHLSGTSGAADRKATRRHFFQSYDHYKRKHHGGGGLIASRVAVGIGCVLRLAIWSGLFLARPGRRERARTKMRFTTWLLLRQVTNGSFS